jgi:pimeloyl-ACP methyl ester carboxylesterase
MAKPVEILHYTACGEGSPVILIHGMAASSHDWEALMPDLAKAGYRALAVDLLGHGESVKPESSDVYTSGRIYAALEGWMAGLKDRPPFILIGHSLGGFLCLNYALRYPHRVSAMALIDPVYSPKQLSPLLRWLNRRPALGVKALQVVPLKVIDTLLGWDPISAPHFPPDVRWQIAVDYKRASPHILFIPRTIPDLTPELERIETQTLVMWGEKDLTLAPGTFSKLVADLPNACGHPIPGSGHQPHIGNPDLVNRLILDFLDHLKEKPNPTG